MHQCTDIPDESWIVLFVAGGKAGVEVDASRSARPAAGCPEARKKGEDQASHTQRKGWSGLCFNQSSSAVDWQCS